MRLHLMAGVCLVICLLGAGLALATDNADFDKAKARSETLAGKLQSYEIHADLVIDQKPKGAQQGMKLEAKQTAAARMPDRLLVKVESAMFNQTWGTGPESSWFFLPQTNVVYQGAPARLNRELEAESAGGLEEERLYDFYAGIGEFLLTSGVQVAAETALKTLTVNGEEVECQVFEFTMGSEGGATEAGRGSYWFDPASGLVLRSLMTTYGTQQGMEIERTMDLSVRSFTLDAEVSEDLFTYTAPEGVRVVDSFELLLNPDSMVGQNAQDITFTTFAGEAIDLRDYRGRVVFLDFWATWCGPCRMEMPHIQKLHEEMKGRGDVVFVGASNEDQKTIQNWLQKNPYTFEIVMVKPEDAHGKFNVSSIPAGFVIDKEGVIKAHLIGAQSEEQLRKALAKAGIK